MKHNMFVIYDAKANAYFQPWFLTTEMQALRVFSDCCNDKEHNFGRHPEDYTLFTIGEFDDATADVRWNAPKSMGNGIEFVIQNKVEQQTDWIDPEGYTRNENGDLMMAPKKENGQ